MQEPNLPVVKVPLSHWSTCLFFPFLFYLHLVPNCLKYWSLTHSCFVSLSFLLPLFEIILKSNTEQTHKRGLGELACSFSRCLFAVTSHYRWALYVQKQYFLLILGFWISNIQLLWVIYNLIESFWLHCFLFSRNNSFSTYSSLLEFHEWAFTRHKMWSLHFLISRARLRKCLWTNPFKEETESTKSL